MRLKTDWILFLTILSMVGFGLVMVYSASSAVAELRYGVAALLLRGAPVGLGRIFVNGADGFKRMDYRRLNTPAWAFSGLGIVVGLLVVVYFADTRAHRWFHVAGLGSLQPSEFAKPALILFLAYFISRRAHTINERDTLRQALMAVADAGGHRGARPDLGTALVPVITAVIVFWVGGLADAIPGARGRRWACSCAS